MKPQLSRALLPFVVKSQAFLERLRLSLVGQDFKAASEQDIYYSYRLFLNRRPDPQGFQTYKDLLKQPDMPIDYLTDAFLASNELRSRQEQRSSPHLVELPFFKLYVRLNDFFIGAAIAREKVYEPHVTAVLRAQLQPGWTFLDIGANIGYYTMLSAAAVQDSGRVIAFEPVAQNRELLDLSLAANHFQNIELYPYAVSDKAQTFALEIDGCDSNGRIIALEHSKTHQPIVAAVALDDFLAALESCHVVKMDIEGAEPLALKGMRGLVEKLRPAIITEFSPQLIRQTSATEPLAYLEELEDLGYKLHLIMPGAALEKNHSPAQIMALFASNPGLGHVDLLATIMA